MRNGHDNVMNGVCTKSHTSCAVYVSVNNPNFGGYLNNNLQTKHFLKLSIKKIFWVSL